MSSDPVASPAPAGGASRSLLGWIGTSNPFYVISAGLFLFGLRLSFGEQAREIDSWALMSGLAGYTLLLAAAALLLVRFARVWNDVRTVLLLVVLMFLATSVTFDELLVLDPERGAMFSLGGFFFAVLVTEGLLDGIRLRLPAGFRIPYYLVLGLFFLYPLALLPLLRDPHGEAMMWALFAFPSAAGLLFLTLLPAVRRGPNYVRGNGSPWPWPFYPWSLFVFLAVAVPARSFLLCWSFHLLGGHDIEQIIFGPYFAVPFGLAVAVVLLELGIVSRNQVTQLVALAFPAGLVVLAGIGHQPAGIYAEFLEAVRVRLGGYPLVLALLAAGAFYSYAWLRGVPFATAGLTAAVAGLAVVGPDTLALADVSRPRVEPLLLAVGFQFALGLWRADGWRVLAAVTPAVAWTGVMGWRGYVALRAEVAGLDYLVAGLALLPVAVLVSLGKAGVLSRWFDAWRGEPTSAG